MKLVPIHKVKELIFYSIDCDEIEIPQTIPLFESRISAGFPSPATDYIELSLDFNSYLVSKPYTTFAVKVEGYSMIENNISPGDILVVDKSVNPVNGKIVVAILNGEFTVKVLKIKDGKYFLEPRNPQFKTIAVSDNDEFEIWGVVTYIVYKAP